MKIAFGAFQTVKYYASNQHRQNNEVKSAITAADQALPLTLLYTIDPDYSGMQGDRTETFTHIFTKEDSAKALEISNRTLKGLHQCFLADGMYNKYFHPAYNQALDGLPDLIADMLQTRDIDGMLNALTVNQRFLLHKRFSEIIDMPYNPFKGESQRPAHYRDVHDIDNAYRDSLEKYQSREIIDLPGDPYDSSEERRFALFSSAVPGFSLPLEEETL